MILDTMAKRYSTKYPNIAGFTAVSSKNFKVDKQFPLFNLVTYYII